MIGAGRRSTAEVGPDRTRMLLLVVVLHGVVLASFGRLVPLPQGRGDAAPTTFAVILDAVGEIEELELPTIAEASHPLEPTAPRVAEERPETPVEDPPVAAAASAGETVDRLEPPVEPPMVAATSTPSDPASTTDTSASGLEPPKAPPENLRPRQSSSSIRERAPRSEVKHPATRSLDRRRSERMVVARSTSGEGAGDRIASLPPGGETSGASSLAAYAALASAEIARRKYYPPAARADGAEGRVSVAFTVGSDGRISRHAITRSSGVASLDQVVSSIMAAVHLPSPPGGSFRGAVTLTFSLTH